MTTELLVVGGVVVATTAAATTQPPSPLSSSYDVALSVVFQGLLL